MQKTTSRFAAIASLALLAACGGQQHLASPALTPAAVQDGMHSVIIKEHATIAPLSTYLGSKSNYTVVQATVGGAASSFTGPDTTGAPGPDGNPAQVVYTRFPISSLKVLRGAPLNVDALAIEGGTAAGQTVEVEGGALLPAEGSEVIAVVATGGSGLPADVRRAAYVFPALDDQHYFLPEWVTSSDTSSPSPVDKEYGAGKARQRGRAADKAQLRQAIIAAP